MLLRPWDCRTVPQLLACLQLSVQGSLGWEHRGQSRATLSAGPSAAPSAALWLGVVNITPKQTLLLIAAAPGPRMPQPLIFRNSEVSTVSGLCSGELA